MRAPDCLDSPVYEPDEERATAQVLNVKERMDPAWRMQIVYAVVVKSVRFGARIMQWLKCEESKKSVGVGLTSDAYVDFVRPIRKAYASGACTSVRS